MIRCYVLLLKSGGKERDIRSCSTNGPFCDTSDAGSEDNYTGRWFLQTNTPRKIRTRIFALAPACIGHGDYHVDQKLERELMCHIVDKCNANL